MYRCTHVVSSGPRLLYTERNFGELEFIENPLHLLLFPRAEESTSRIRNEEPLEGLVDGETTSRVQLLRVREKHRVMQELRKEHEQNSPLQITRLLTKDIVADLRSRLRAYKEKREELVKKLRVGTEQRPDAVQSLFALAGNFEAYAQSILGTNTILFERLLQLHSALLLALACEDEAESHSDSHLTKQERMLFGSCSLLAPWGAPISRRSSHSLIDTILWWLGDMVFGLTERREARSSALPLADAATLRLSAAVDKLTRESALARVASIAGAAMAERKHACKVPCYRCCRCRGTWRLSRHRRRAGHRLILRGVLAAASDFLVREACLQLRSPRRRQQREEMQQLFQRGVASQPADATAFADLDADLANVCSLVAVPLTLSRPPSPLADASIVSAMASAGDIRSRAVSRSGVIIELLETKAWIILRTFDVVTGRLVKEKLLSTFASEQQRRRPGIGQWACEGWKGPTESHLYLYHLCILLATLLTIGGVALASMIILRRVAFFTAQSLVRLARLSYYGHRPTSHTNSPESGQEEPFKLPNRHQPQTRLVAAAIGAIAAVGAAAAILLFMNSNQVHFRL